MNKWLWVRLAILPIGFIQGVMASETEEVFGGADWQWGLAIFAFGVIGMLFVIGIQRWNPWSATVWRYPSWQICPFLIREPLQFFHFLAFYLLADGFGLVAHSLFVGEAGSLAMLILAYGFGTICGVHACTLVFRSKMKQGSA